ncbi:uncharacterized protein Hap1MRO34_024582 [Clarias gariepinus]
MKSQVTLLLICMLFPKALSLTCQQCLPLAAVPCKITQIPCSNQCLTSTTAMYMNSIQISNDSSQICGTSNNCVSGSITTGTVKVSINTKCCSTDLCNNQTLPELSQQSTNGKICYTCDESSCSGTVSCRGDEDRCISASVKVGGNTVSVKGCVSTSLCAASEGGIGVTDFKCCEGNLCNSAESFTLSFLPMIIALLSSFLLY